MTEELRFARIEARFAIENAMQDYAEAADAKYTPDRQKCSPEKIAAAAKAQAAVFAEDAVWSGGGFGGTLKGREALAGLFETSPWLFTSHHYGAARITISDDATTATARWQLMEIGIRDSDARVVLLTGTVTQDWRACNDGWRIARMGFDRLHAVELSTDPTSVKCLIPCQEEFK